MVYKELNSDETLGVFHLVYKTNKVNKFKFKFLENISNEKLKFSLFLFTKK